MKFNAAIVGRKLGTISSMEQTIILVAAVALCLMLLSLVFNLWPMERSVASGSRNEVSRFLAEKVVECFKKHNYGLDPKSAVCGEFVIDSNGTVTETDITKHIDCSKMPNSDCPGCEACRSPGDGGENRLHVDITREKTFVSIEYLASDRRVEVREFGCFSNEDCGDGDTCTQDICLFPGTKDSACSHRYSCVANETQTEGCAHDSDCIPAQCCHPTSCVLESNVPNCAGIMCSVECQPGTMDCGAGSCVCIEGNCVVEWAG